LTRSETARIIGPVSATPPGRLAGWVAAVCSIGLGLVAAFVGAVDTQRTCALVFDQACDGPHWGDAALAFGIAVVLLTAGIAVVVRLRRSAGVRVDAGDDG
jgi:hypothetical protein